MNSTLTTLAAALIGCGVSTGAAHAQSMPELKFSGFGTVAAVHSTERNADFIGTLLQPNGAGYTNAWSFGPDSKLGGQVNAAFTDKFSAVVQLVSQHNYDNSWTPAVEWANLKYQVTSELSVRGGRIALPTFLLSESRFVGYASPWVRPPVEVYGVVPITSNDGIDATYRSQIGSANNAVQLFYGKSEVKIPRTTVKSNSAWGVTDSLELGSFTVHASYSALNLSLSSDRLNGLLDGLNKFGAAPAPIGPHALALADKYKLDDMKVSTAAVGATYDPGNWFVMSEFADFKGAGILANSRSWYLSAGYRLAAFTPYATYASTKADTPPLEGVTLPSAAALNAGLNGVLRSQAVTQHTVSVGVRWDFMKNLAVKAQFDRVTTSDGSLGRYTNVQPGFVSGSSANLATVALDFVF